jgi:tRNA (guanine9-N1)-methyltransferase
VLTVNQVLDILLSWVEHRDWKKALFDVIPQRKFEVVSKKARRGQKRIQGDGEKESDGDDAEMDEEIHGVGESGDASHLRANIGDLSQAHA